MTAVTHLSLFVCVFMCFFAVASWFCDECRLAQPLLTDKTACDRRNALRLKPLGVDAEGRQCELTTYCADQCILRIPMLGLAWPPHSKSSAHSSSMTALTSLPQWSSEPLAFDAVGIRSAATDGSTGTAAEELLTDR